MKKKAKKNNAREIDPGIRRKFGKEHCGIFRRILRWIKHMLKPETTVNDGDLWVLFRTNEHKAMGIAKSVVDVIEMDFTRTKGEEFLTAFTTLAHTCTPDTINQIFRMMFKRPVYFDRSLSRGTVRWLVSLPSAMDQNITLSVSPIKVEYLSEFCIRENLLTESGPYISANFTTKHDQGSTIVETSGTFQVHTAAEDVFGGEWNLPGVMRYSVTVSLSYVENTSIGLDTSLLMEIIRRCVADVLYGVPLWTGFFGEDRPSTKKKGAYYYRAVVGYIHPEQFDRVEGNLIQTAKKTTTVKTTEYAATLGASPDTICENPHFEISSDKVEVSQPEHSFMITIYPPLEDLPKKTPVNTTVDVHHTDYSNTNPSNGWNHPTTAYADHYNDETERSTEENEGEESDDYKGE